MRSWRYWVAAIPALICLAGAALAFSNGDYLAALAFVWLAAVFGGGLLLLILARERRADNPKHISNAGMRERFLVAVGMVVGMLGFILAVPANDMWPGIGLVVVGCLLMVSGRWLADHRRTGPVGSDA